jgi:hypothetical protein
LTLPNGRRAVLNLDWRLGLPACFAIKKKKKRQIFQRCCCFFFFFFFSSSLLYARPGDWDWDGLLGTGCLHLSSFAQQRPRPEIGGNRLLPPAPADAMVAATTRPVAAFPNNPAMAGVPAWVPTLAMGPGCGLQKESTAWNKSLPSAFAIGFNFREETGLGVLIVAVGFIVVIISLSAEEWPIYRLMRNESCVSCF